MSEVSSQMMKKQRKARGMTEGYEETLSDSDLTSNLSYFDPPIENYRAFNYNSPAQGYGQANGFFVMRGNQSSSGAKK